MNNLTKKKGAFTLAETLATLIISAMIMIAALGIYSSVRRAAAAINERIERYGLPTEILQRIAEDIDSMIVTVTDTKIIVNNKQAEGNYSSGQLIIESTIYDTNNKPQTFKKIVWQSQKDPDDDGMILYRAHSGYMVEDRMLDEPKENYQRELFVPICKGLTHFGVQVIKREELLDKWTDEKLPMALMIMLSFAEPVENLTGEYEVPEEETISRTIAVDRTREIIYAFVKEEYILPIDESDPNEVESEPNEIETEPNERKPESPALRE